MNCREAQSKLTNYIDHKLDTEETKDFIEHVRVCADCKEELEIYYILLVGMRRLDEGLELGVDFQKKLWEEMDAQYAAILRQKKRQSAARFFTALVGAALLFWLIAQILFFFGMI